MAIIGNACGHLLFIQVLVWLLLLPEEAFKHFLYARKIHYNQIISSFFFADNFFCAKQGHGSQTHTVYISEDISFLALIKRNCI